MVNDGNDGKLMIFQIVNHGDEPWIFVGDRSIPNGPMGLWCQESLIPIRRFLAENQRKLEETTAINGGF